MTEIAFRSAPQTRVQEIAEAVTQEVEGENSHRDGGRGPDQRQDAELQWSRQPCSAGSLRCPPPSG